MHFSNATWFESKLRHDIWMPFWSAGVQYTLHILALAENNRDAGLTSDVFWDLTEVSGVELQLSPAEAHNVMMSGERYDTQLRRIYSTVLISYPHLRDGQFQGGL